MTEEPVDLAAPDILPYRTGNTGIPWITRLDGFRPGPHAMIAAVTHGNEICGAIALAFLMASGFRPACGRVTLAFMNAAAYRRFSPADPHAARFVEEDLNRVWDETVLDGPESSIERDRARALRPLVDTVDALLDIHSMQSGTAPLVLAGMRDKNLDFARAMALPGIIVRDAGHRGGRRLRDYGRFDDPASPATALLIECGQHWRTATAETARLAALRFLDGLGMMPADYRARHLPAAIPAAPAAHIEVTHAVTVESPDFAFARAFEGLERIARAGTVIAYDGAREIATPYDDCVLVMPSRRLAPGQTAVRLGRFVVPPARLEA